MSKKCKLMNINLWSISYYITKTMTIKFIINHNLEQNDYSDFVPPDLINTGRYPSAQVENDDSNYESENNLDSCSSTLHFAGINHISNINIDQNAFLHEPDINTANTNSTGIGYDFNSNNSYQSFSTTQTFAALTNVNSLAQTSNNQIQFNEVNNYSMTSYSNLSTFQPQVDYEEEED